MTFLSEFYYYFLFYLFYLFFFQGVYLEKGLVSVWLFVVQQELLLLILVVALCILLLVFFFFFFFFPFPFPFLLSFLSFSHPLSSPSLIPPLSLKKGIGCPNYLHDFGRMWGRKEQLRELEVFFFFKIIIFILLIYK